MTASTFPLPGTAVLTAATQSDQETGTSTGTYVSPARQQYHKSAAKVAANVTISGGTPTLNFSYNVTSITDNAVGQFTVNITTSFSAVNQYAIGGMCRSTSSTAGWIGITPATATTASAFKIDTVNNAGSLTDNPENFIIALGDQ